MPPHAGTVPARYVWIIARTRVAPESLGHSFRRAAQALDSNVPILTLASLPGILASNYRDTAKDAVLFLIFAAIALLLASAGLYAVIAHAVSRRTQEFGIRMAVGASARDILKLVFLQGMLPLGIGLAIGLATSVAVDRVLKSELVRVSPTDPLTLIVAAGVLILAAMLGCWIPARRAMRVDPMEALRHE
jgi:putative ABC transport system permease protein